MFTSALLRFLAATVLLIAAATASAQTRHALVIGNDAYSDVPVLQKAVNDAIAMTDALSVQGFEVTTLTDAPRRSMNRAISDFTQRLAAGDTALVFYAGHGVEIDGENYLLPTDIEAPQSGDSDFVKAESIALSRLLDQIRATGARTTLAIVDACRENPFAASTGRSIGTARGLGRIAAPEGTFVIFSAGAGQLALDRLSDDDPDQNSVFTRALLPLISKPDLELRSMIAQVRRDVRNLAASVGHRQFPAYYDELLGEFFIAPASLDVAEPAPEPAPANATIREDFALAREIGTPQALRAFVNRYEDSDDFVVSLAREMLEALSGLEPEPVPVREAAVDPEPVDPATLAEAPEAPALEVEPVDPGTLVEAPPEPEPETEIAAVPPEPQPQTAPDPDPARELIRASQAELNRIGCDAGPADGIAGRKTRDAFARYLSLTNTGLRPGDLGSERALEILRGWKNRVCPVVAAPAPSDQPTGWADISGTWSFQARCLFGVRAWGTAWWERSGNGFAGTIRNNLGQRGTTWATRNDRTLSGRTDWVGTFDDTWTATLSADGKSYSGRTSLGCTFTASRS